MSLRHTHATRFLSLTLLAGLFALLTGDLGDAAEKKGKAEKTQKNAASAAAVPKTAGGKLDAAALSRLIDDAVAARLREEKVAASPRSDDAEFVRRVYLDLVGHVPPADKAAAFLDSKDPNKRAKLIDELLASPEYGRHFADIWEALLIPRNNSENRRLNREPLAQWLEDHFNRNTPWSRTARELLTASGPQDKNGAVTFYVANASVDKMTDQVSKLLLGVQLQCAQCHNHPFTDWKQTDYWGMAAFFLKVDPMPPAMAARQGVAPTVEEKEKPRRVRNPLPESAKLLAPKFLAGAEARVPAAGPVRPALADWLTTAENPYFSKATVNRLWAHFFGRGLVNPVDDMHAGNSASHPRLLAELAEQFATNGFDLKYVIRGICNSQAYQRTSKPTGDNAHAAPELYSRMAVKVLTPEQLFDSYQRVLGRPLQAPERAGKQGQGPNFNPRTAFVNFFNIEDGSDPTEYQVGIPQALRLMNGPALSNPARFLEMAKAGKKPDEVILQMYLATVSRRPRPAELNKMTKYVKDHEGAKAYGDILWALLNSSEFTLNH